MKGLGWKGDLLDFRDFRYPTIAKAVPRPPVYDGWHHFILDQKNMGSCGPHSAVAHLSAVVKQNNMPDESWYSLSPLFLYYAYRETTGEINVDSGVYNRVMLQVMQKVGVCKEELWPYVVDNWKKKPPVAAYQDAVNRQILKYYLVSGLEEMKNAIAEGYGFLGGIPVYDSFDSLSKDYVVPMPGKGDKFLGGHDIYFHSYDDHKQILWFQNSWGSEWGKEGHAALPYDYAATMLSACYTIRVLEG